MFSISKYRFPQVDRPLDSYFVVCDHGGVGCTAVFEDSTIPLAVDKSAKRVLSAVHVPCCTFNSHLA